MKISGEYAESFFWICHVDLAQPSQILGFYILSAGQADAQQLSEVDRKNYLAIPCPVFAWGAWRATGIITTMDWVGFLSAGGGSTDACKRVVWWVPTRCWWTPKQDKAKFL